MTVNDSARSPENSRPDFELDRFQREAIAAIDAGHSVLVSAPTGSGKTVVAEHAVRRARAEGKKAFYTTPIKALSNQKYHDLVAEHGPGEVGLLTGDTVIEPDAPIVVMTTEVLRNMLYAGSGALKNLAWVVLDEVHYLQDRYRGAVWEEVLIHTPQDVRFVCLSATVSNVQELTDWLIEVRGPTDAVVESTRPVRLEHHYLVHDSGARRLLDIPVLVKGTPNRKGQDYDSSMHRPMGPGQRGRPRKRWYTPRRLEVLQHLANTKRLPAIHFVFSRAGCDESAREVLDSGLVLTSEAEQAEIREILDRHTGGLDRQTLAVLDYARFAAAVEIGAAPHHAGLVPPFKTAVEECFLKGLAKVVFATETLALGINMPARTVVIDNLSRFRGDGHQILTPGEFTQLTGRAGRRGIDPLGHAMVLWSRFVPFSQVATLATSRDFPLISAFRPTYNMVVNLVAGHDPTQARQLLEKSFAQFQRASQLETLRARRRAQRQELKTLQRSRPARREPRRLDQLEGEVAETSRRIQDAQDSLADRFGRMLAVLESFGALEGWSLTDRGEILVGVFHECDLLFAVCVAQGVFDDLSPEALAGLVSVFTYEHRSRVPPPAPLFPQAGLRERFEEIVAVQEALDATQKSERLEPARDVDATFLATAHAWASGHNLAMVVDDQELPAGDFVRNIRRLIDLCGQLAKVAPQRLTRQRARAAADLLSRDVVEETL